MPTKTAGSKVAVAGAGRWGRNLVRVCRDLGALKYIVDEQFSSRAEMERQYPEVEVAGGLDKVLADPEVAGVLLATPAVTHYRLAGQVLAAGRHVFVEKPLALSLAEGRELVALAGEASLCLMVDHLMQGHAAYTRLKQLVLAGELGDIRHVHSRRLSFGRIRNEEDVWWSFAPHDISMILGLTGREPQSAVVSGDCWLSPGLPDMAEARLDFGRGLTARISVNWLNPVKEQRLVVIGDKKSAVLDDALPWSDKLRLYDHRVENREGRPTAVAGPVQAVELSEAEPLKAQVEAFLAAMAGGPEPAASGREGLKVLAVLEAGARSMAQGGAPQRIGEIEPGYFAHPTAEVDEGAAIGPGTKIWHFSHVLGGSRIGENCNIGQNVVIGPKVTIGRGVKIQNNVSVYEGVTLEDEVFCGPSMVFTNVVNPRANVNRKNEYRSTLVGRGASIGANATVVCGHSLGPWCFIGAGAVVTKDVPAYALMIGNPARQSGWMCRCGEKLPESLVCEACGRSYAMSGHNLKAMDLEEEGGA